MEDPDVIEELEDHFKFSLFEAEGNEQVFRDLLNEVRAHKNTLRLPDRESLSTEKCHRSTMNSQASTFQHSSRSSGSLEHDIEVEDQKRIQLENVISQMQRKLIDKQKLVDQLKEAFSFTSRDQRGAMQEELHFRQLHYESRLRQQMVHDYLDILKAGNEVKKTRLKQKHSKISQELKELQREYAAFRAYQKKLEEQIALQLLEIRELDEHREAKIKKFKEQATTIYFANCFKQLESMFLFDDPQNLFAYKFKERVTQAKRKREQSPQLTEEFFTTQVEVAHEEIFEEEADPDQELMALIKKGDQSYKEALSSFELSQELLTFTEFIIHIYQEYQQQFEKLKFEYISLNERKHEQRQNLNSIVYYRYPETCNGLINYQLSDNFNNKQSTLNIMGTSVEIYLSGLRHEDEVKRMQKAVLRLHHFIRNHVVRVHRIIGTLHKLTSLVPREVQQLIEQIYSEFLVNESIKTPQKPLKNSMTASIASFELGKEFMNAKHQKIIPIKSMSTTVLGANIGTMKIQQTIQEQVKHILMDEIDRLFISQDLIDDFAKEFTRVCLSQDPTEEQLPRLVQNQRELFTIELRKRTQRLISSTLARLGQFCMMVRKEILSCRQKGLQVQEITYKPGQCLSFENNPFIQNQTQFNSQLTSENLSRPTIHNPTESQKSNRDIFTALKKITKHEFEDLGGDSDDSFEKDRQKIKSTTYYVKTNAPGVKEKSFCQDVFSRLNPAKKEVNKDHSQRITQLRSLRLNQKSVAVNESEVKTQLMRLKGLLDRPQPFAHMAHQKKETFRKLFSTSEQKLKKPTSVTKSQTASQLLHPSRVIKQTGDDVEQIFRKKLRAKRVMNVITAKGIGGVDYSDMSKFGFLEQI